MTTGYLDSEHERSTFAQHHTSRGRKSGTQELQQRLSARTLMTTSMCIGINHARASAGQYERSNVKSQVSSLKSQASTPPNIVIHVSSNHRLPSLPNHSLCWFANNLFFFFPSSIGWGSLLRETSSLSSWGVDLQTLKPLKVLSAVIDHCRKQFRFFLQLSDGFSTHYYHSICNSISIGS